jgi:hypothetical protein
MNADKLVPRVRDWLNARVGRRHICVHLRSSAAKIPRFLIGQPQRNATRRAPRPAHPHPAAKPTTTAPFKPLRTDPLNREPTAKPATTASFKPLRTDPLNREPTANPGSTAPFKPSPADLLNQVRSRRAPQPRGPHRAEENPMKQARLGALPPWFASRPTPTKGGKAPPRVSAQRPDRNAPASS